MPEALSERVTNALKADPRTVDLRALAPHFYNLSERILELFEEEELVDVLINVRLPRPYVQLQLTITLLDFQAPSSSNCRPGSQSAGSGRGWC
jgi:hypothetical protein